VPCYCNTLSFYLLAADVIGKPAIKSVVASIYTNYTTEIIDDEGMEQVDGYAVGPKGDKLILQFKRAG
jgi:hypothetical protein